MPALPGAPRPLLPLTVRPNFRIIAHRGASGYAPENTRAAFSLARELGAKEVEFDLQFSKDRRIVICHDRGLDRFGYPGVTLGDLTWEELRVLDVGSWFSPRLFGGESLLLLEDFLSEFGQRFLHHAEIKEPGPGLAAAILDVLALHGVEGRTTVTSFHFDAVAEVRRLAPAIRVGWLVRAGEFTSQNVAKAAAEGFDQICPPASEVDSAGVKEALKAIGEVRAHSIKGIADLAKAIEAGCIGATVNWPDWLVHDRDAPKSSP